MKRSLWLFHPITIFSFSIIALGLSLFLYIYWYVEVSTGLPAVIQKTNLDPKQFVAWQTWVVIMIMSILVGIILIGIFMIFIYQRKTQALYRSQRKFINSFTHELKTPVTSLQLYLETFSKHELPRDKQLNYLNYMLEDVSRLTNSINTILNLARIEAKIYSGELIVVDLQEEVDGFHRLNKQLFRGSDILIKHNRDRCYYCSINHPLFQMLMMNLLTNAIRHNESARPQVTIDFSQTEKDVHIHFIDNGIGFEKSQAKKIFNKFFQIERKNQPYAGGTGLGLYTVEQIVGFHKGKVIARSEGAGQGAEITVSLPSEKHPHSGDVDKFIESQNTTEEKELCEDDS